MKCYGKASSPSSIADVKMKMTKIGPQGSMDCGEKMHKYVGASMLGLGDEAFEGSRGSDVQAVGCAV